MQYQANLTMIARIKLFCMCFFVCSDIKDRYKIRQASFTLVLEVSCITINLGVVGFSCRIYFIFESSQLSEFLTDLKTLVSKNYFIILGTGLSSHESIHVIVIFQHLIKHRTIF